MEGYASRRVTIRPDQDEWLKKHSEINVSGLLQAAIDEIMKKVEA